MNQPGILGTGASLASDLSLLAYLLLIVPVMLFGFFFARRKMFEPHHKLVMTTITIVNWIIIFFLMAVSYRDGVLPWINYSPGDPRVALPTIHLVTGLTAQLLGTYLVARMWLEKILPKWIMVKRIKRYMRFTLALWLVTASLGITIYFAFYVRPTRASDLTPPVATPEVNATGEAGPNGTAEVNPNTTPDVTPEVSGSGENASIAPASTSEIKPVETEEVDDDADDNDDNGDDDNSGKGSGDDSGSNSGSGKDDDGGKDNSSKGGSGSDD